MWNDVLTIVYLYMDMGKEHRTLSRSTDKLYIRDHVINYSSQTCRKLLKSYNIRYAKRMIYDVIRTGDEKLISSFLQDRRIKIKCKEILPAMLLLAIKYNDVQMVTNLVNHKLMPGLEENLCLAYCVEMNRMEIFNMLRTYDKRLKYDITQAYRIAVDIGNQLVVRTFLNDYKLEHNKGYTYKSVFKRHLVDGYEIARANNDQGMCDLIVVYNPKIVDPKYRLKTY